MPKGKGTYGKRRGRPKKKKRKKPKRGSPSPAPPSPLPSPQPDARREQLARHLDDCTRKCPIPEEGTSIADGCKAKADELTSSGYGADAFDLAGFALVEFSGHIDRGLGRGPVTATGHPRGQQRDGQAQSGDVKRHRREPAIGKEPTRP